MNIGIRTRIKPKMKPILLILVLVFVALPVTAIPTKRIDVYVFSSETCGACREMSAFLEELYKQYPTMVIQQYDIKEEENKALYDLFKEAYTLDMRGHPVPIVFVGKDSFQGYGPGVRELLEKKVAGCFKAEGCSIALTVERDCIVIVDHTPTPELSGFSFLLPFLVLAGVFCCLNPYNVKIVSQIRKRNFPFLLGYVVTSLVLCFALSTVLLVVGVLLSLPVPLVVIAVVIGVFSVVSVVYPVLNVPQSVRTALSNLIADNTGFSFFAAGIGACLASLVYTAGLYLLVVYNVFSLSLEEQLLNFGIFNAVLISVFTLVYRMMAERNEKVYYSIVGIGSIGLAVFFWLVQVVSWM